MSTVRTCFALLVAIFAVSIYVFAGTEGEVVRTDGGAVEGLPVLSGDVIMYRGIPYAAPPVGNLRWKAPQPVTPWQGIRKAYNFGPSCIQNIVSERNPWTWEFMTHGNISEDCLYLNVWKAKSGSNRKPVLVFIHGGGYIEGSTEVPVYDGEALARKGLVVVTMNYRLGVFGFFAHPELTAESAHHVSGNQGLLDQVAALEWIHRNIEAFGGDPSNVTIAGQSAGAGSVHSLTASPLAKGLFERAIADSGSGIANGNGTPRMLADAEAAGAKFAQDKGAHSLAELRNMPWKDLVSFGSGAPADARFRPIIDGYFLPEPEVDIFAEGKQNDVPTITGYNADEGGAEPAPKITAAEYEMRAQQRFTAKADEFLKLYPAASDEQARANQNESSRDQERTSMYLWVVRRNKTSKTKVYTYFWTHPIPGPDSGQYGAFHTSDIPYFMNSLAKSDRPWQESDKKFGEMLSSYWVNFATTGDPNGKGLPEWPAVGDSPMTMQLGDKCGPIPVASPARFEFLRDWLLAAH